MTHSRLRDKFVNTKGETDRKACNKQRNYCVTLIRKEKQKFFGNINTTDITGHKQFWRAVKPFFTDKVTI